MKVFFFLTLFRLTHTASIKCIISVRGKILCPVAHPFSMFTNEKQHRWTVLAYMHFYGTVLMNEKTLQIIMWAHGPHESNSKELALFSRGGFSVWEILSHDIKSANKLQKHIPLLNKPLKACLFEKFTSIHYYLNSASKYSDRNLYFHHNLLLHYIQIVLIQKVCKDYSY